MNKLIITQRLEFTKKHAEFRESLDTRWSIFAEKNGLILIPISSRTKKLNLTIKTLNVNGIILSGGGDINNNDERCRLEKKLIDFSIDKKIPLIGVCRGAQAINKYFKGKQKKILNHVRKKHLVSFKKNVFKGSVVNSYHDYGFDEKLISKELDILGSTNDGVVEYFKHKKYKIFGIMWHPERYKGIKSLDIKIFGKIFKK